MSFGTRAVDYEERVDYEQLRKDRLSRAQEQRDAHELGALLCFDFDNIRYITGTTIGEWARDKMNRFTVLPENQDPVLFDPAAPAKRESAPWLAGNIRSAVSSMRGAIPPEVGRVERVASEIVEVLEAAGVADEPLGVDIADYTLIRELERQGISIKDGQQAMLDARIVKTDDEIELLRLAGSMVDAAYDVVAEKLRPGIQENELVAEVNKTLYEKGSDLVECVNCVSGPRGSPHPHMFSDRMIRPDEIVYLDIMHSYNGYRTCYYRTFCCGEPTEGQQEAYDKAWRWLKGSMDAVKPGATTADIARQWPSAEELGFANEEEAFLLQFGHGIGMSIWEKPVISRLFSLDHPFEIKEGMTFALETWCPVEDEEGAARIEEEVVVTEDGAEPLFRYPADHMTAVDLSGV